MTLVTYRSKTPVLVHGDASWYKDAIIYELHVRAFADSNGDGIGDFRGLTSKLDYLQDLGVTALWLLPFYPSPLKDDGYDIADYTDIHPAYGTLHDFKVFLAEAHQRGLRVITELVINHTSDQHVWFRRARQARPGSRWHNYYVWSDTVSKYHEARIIFKDFESSNWAWDQEAQAYYWHRFYAHQPDLNYDNPRVWRAVFRVMDFWLALGVDGLRLDAVPYLYEQEGTSCENLSATHAFLKALRQHIDSRFPGRMLLAEANQWPEDAVAYFGNGDECHMAFHFPLMPRLFMAVRMEDRFPILDIMQQTPAIPEDCQWALFLRNHDELTLEMVTDEERDYMYRVYAHDSHARVNLGIRRRLAPLLGNDRRRIELMYGLLCALPGTPVLYYGDEIGMGDNFYLGDRNGVRTPMQWSADRNAGFSRATPQKLYLPIIIDPEYHYEAINVEAQQNNPQSFLWQMKRLLALRKRFQAFGRGQLTFLTTSNHKVLAFTRHYQGECLLIVANMSRFAQSVSMTFDEALHSKVPVELFGRTRFPSITAAPYALTLGPHDFYWFALEPQPVGDVTMTARDLPLPTLVVSNPLESLLQHDTRAALEAILPAYLRARRWFGGKARTIKAVSLLEALPFSWLAGETFLTLLQVEYTEGDPETYLLPLTVARGERAVQMQAGFPHPLLACLQGWDGVDSGLLYDALYDQEFNRALLDAMARHRRLKGREGELIATPTRAFRLLQDAPIATLTPRVMQVEQSNTSVVYGERFVLKLLRHPEAGVHPEVEIGAFLTEKVGFTHTPPFAGAIAYRRTNGEHFTLAILSGFAQNQGDAWHYTLDALSGYHDMVMARRVEVEALPLPPRSLEHLLDTEIPPLTSELIGSYLAAAALLGQRTAELHLALSQQVHVPDFMPEPFSPLYQRALYQSMRSLTGQTIQRLGERYLDLPESARADAQQVLQREGDILKRLQTILQRKITAVRTRIHGDYHLGQVLYTGKDFVIIDFEGEPARALSERRIKRSPLRDVASMLRSFHYAAATALSRQGRENLTTSETLAFLEHCTRCWYTAVGVVFLRAYLTHADQAPFVPHAHEELSILLEAYLLEKAIYELAYELNNRPQWVSIPLRAILDLLEPGTD